MYQLMLFCKETTQLLCQRVDFGFRPSKARTAVRSSTGSRGVFARTTAALLVG